ncbi:zf-TFIIB domain-containing protein [Myxococcus sp. K15C18031901]|uniref:TFIIB-type zinc ribbon-containing protein n=1 Tax=Myxococcus dinghuensis TaxID=2906761 RepID=UPI0020A7CCCA|nr:zf-TFIIB domain-containing protein [Myxococcus dinghuensis]MCP3101594.1 zf-TFIIB domain-containing protein [Myxococcus dinghuensis]
MSACPFCQQTMRPTFIGGLSREECDGCGAVWFEGEALAKVLGGSFSEALVRRARGKPGVCKGCSVSLQYVPACPECGATAPTCPRCGKAPLPAVEALGITVEACPDCAGVALDPGELQQLQQAAAQYRSVPLDVRPQLGKQETSTCAACRRKLEPRYGFVWEEKLYCGSCAPEGAAPFTDELTKARPSAEPSFPSGAGGTEALAVGATGDAAGSALTWLFSRMFGQ